MFEAVDKFMKANTTGLASNAEVIGTTMVLGGAFWGIDRGDGWFWKRESTGKVDLAPLALCLAGLVLPIIFVEKKA